MNVYGCYLEIKDFFRVMAIGSHKGFQCLHVCFWIPKITFAFEDELIYSIKISIFQDMYVFTVSRTAGLLVQV